MFVEWNRCMSHHLDADSSTMFQPWMNLVIWSAARLRTSVGLRLHLRTQSWYETVWIGIFNTIWLSKNCDFCLHLVALPAVLSGFYRATACNATHGIAIASLSVRLSVCLSDARIVTKLNDALRIFWYYTKQQSLQFSDANSGWWEMLSSLSNIRRKWSTPCETDRTV